MKPKLSIKTLFRSPVRTALTFILIAAVTFALFSQVMEYSIAVREMNKAVEQYEGVGTVEVSPLPEAAENTTTPLYMYTDERISIDALPEYWQDILRGYGYERLSGKQVEFLSSLPYVSSVDTRYMTAGYSDTLKRIDDGPEFYEFTNQCVIEATVYYTHADRITAGDIELIAGVPRRPFGDDFIYIIAQQTGDNYLGWQSVMNKIPLEECMFFARGAGRAINVVTANSEYDEEYMKNLTVGSRYVFVIRYEDYSNNLADLLPYYMTDPFVGEYCQAVYCIDDAPENYLETEEYAPLAAYIDSVNTRLYTFDVVYTGNMDSIRYFADKTIGISEGRGITPEDAENENNVCVIHHDLAYEYDLEVGDTITLGLGDKLFEQYISSGAISVSPNTESERITEVTLEVVGIFKDTRNDNVVQYDPCWTYSVNTVFVPSHLLNVSAEELENHTFAPGEFSFVVDNAWDIQAFMEEGIPQIEEEGLTLYFSDGGWLDMLKDYRETQRMALIKIAVLLAAVLIATCFVAYLYIVGKRREYAIMRVLGTSKKKAGGALLLPLSVMAALAVLAGTAAAYLYTTLNIKNSDALKFLGEAEAIDTGISAGVVVACILGEIILVLLIAFVLLAVVGRNSPLALIQQSAQKQKTVRKSRKTTVSEPSEPVKLGQWVSIPPLKRDGNDRSFKFVVRYVSRHIRRSLGKAVLFVLVSVLLLSVLGQLNIMNRSYIEIFEGTEILSNYAGNLNIHYVSDLQESGYAGYMYYHKNGTGEVNGVSAEVYVTSDIERYLGESVEITYADGYDESVMQRVGNHVIMGKDLMKEQGFKLGDTVRLSDEGALSKIQNKAVTQYLTGHDMPQNMTPEEEEAWRQGVYEEYADYIEEKFSRESTEFIIVGSLESSSGNYDRAMFTPGCAEAVNRTFGMLVILDEIEAVLADNWQVDDYRLFGQELAAANLTGEIAFVMDDGKLDNVRNNIKLMDTLYPLVVAAVLVIGAFLCGLLIVQTSKDIAIMRVLGTSRNKTRAILIAEQMVICAVGIALAAAVTAARGVSSAVYTRMIIAFILYLAAIFAASWIASSMATRKNALELLQTKE